MWVLGGTAVTGWRRELSTKSRPVSSQEPEMGEMNRPQMKKARNFKTG
jgi:hypothetical protein